MFTWSLPGGYRIHDTALAVTSFFLRDQISRGLDTVDRDLLLWLGPVDPDMAVLPGTGVHASTVRAVVRMASHVSDKQMEEVRRAALVHITGELPASWSTEFEHHAKHMKATLLADQMLRAKRTADLLDGRAVRLAPAVHFFGDVHFFSNWRARLAELDLDDVSRLVQHLAPERVGMVLVTARDQP